MKNGTPNLTELRKHIRREGWNGGSLQGSNRDVFAGMCEYASTSLSEMLTGEEGNWSLRVRGWYTGDCSALRGKPGAQFSETREGHPHSWVVFNGKIIDPTWWQFTDAWVKVYEFDLNDPRFVPDESA